MSKTAFPVNFTVSAQILTGPGHYFGISARETAGAAASIEVYDSANSTVAGKPVLFAMSMNGAAANASALDITDIFVHDGIYIVVTGTLKGSVRT